MEKRRIIETKDEELMDYNRYGKVSSGLKWIPLSKDESLDHEVFIIRFEADSSSNLHRHNGYEEFYVLNGELIDSDGKVFKKVIILNLKKVVNISPTQKQVAPYWSYFMVERTNY